MFFFFVDQPAGAFLKMSFVFFYMKGSIVVKITQEKQVNAKSVSVSFSGAPLGTLNLSWKPEQLPR